MPTYEFRCKKCNNIYEELLDMNESTNKVKCSKCKSKKKERVFLSAPCVIFANPVGTSKYDNFGYQAKDRYVKAGDERRAAEEASHMGKPLIMI